MAAPDRAVAARRGLLALGTAVALLSSVACAGGDSAQRVPRGVAEDNIQIGEETPEALIQAASSPSVAVHPRNEDNLVVGYRIELPAYSCAVAVSFDGGTQWEPSRLDLPPGAERCYTTSLAFDAEGIVHLAFVTLAGPGNVPSGVWLARSEDGGRSFLPAVEVLGKEKFMVRLAVDRVASPARIFLTWVEAAGVGFLRMTPPSAVMMMTSTDGGATFGPPVRVSPPQRDKVGAPVPVAGRNGAVTVVYYDYRKDIFDFQNIQGVYEDTFELVAARSTDGGATFSETAVAGDIRPPEPFLVFTPPFPAAAADTRTGAMYAAWSDARAGAPAVLLSTSSDGGARWSRPVRISTAEERALLPQISVSATGRLDVVYAAVEAGEGQRTRVRFTSSADGGRTFGPVTALNEPFRRDWFPAHPRPGTDKDLGSLLGLQSTGKGAYAVWPDSRRGDSAVLRVDIVGAPVRIAGGGRQREPSPA